MGKYKSRILPLTLSFIFLFSHLHSAYAKTDGFIFTDPVAATYTGRPQATQLISNLRFTDLPPDPGSRDAIVRSGVLNMIKPYEKQYNPGAVVTKEEAIAFVLRAVGLENQAQEAGVRAMGTFPPDSPLRTVWSLGYLLLARNMGLITAAEYATALSDEAPGGTDQNLTFMRTDPVTREEIAHWLVQALRYVNRDILTTGANQQSIYKFEDWGQLSPARVNSVEHILRLNIMKGVSDTRFNPRGTINRLETAVMLKNMDILHYNIVGLEKKTGTVAGFGDEQYNETGSNKAWRLLYVRRADGKVDVLQYGQTSSSSPQDGPEDAVVLRGGQIGGLTSLREGDQIEYLVEPETESVWYVQVTGGLDKRESPEWRLQLINLAEGVITFSDDGDRVYTFPMAEGLYGYEADGSGYIRFSNEKRPSASLPLGSRYRATIVNNVVTALEFIGEPVLRPETRGIVVENNPLLGYLTIVDGNGRRLDYVYNTGELRVQKREHYDMRDTIGSIHSLFPDYHYNPYAASIADVEAGDIVSFRTDPDDPERIISIYASTNYTTRYGRIISIREENGMYNMVMQYENGVTASFSNIAARIPAIRGGRPVKLDTIKAGDWARLLINQEFYDHGYYIDSVKEIALEGDGHHINTIVKGQLAGYNAIQKQLSVQNAQTLTNAGWANYKQLEHYNIGGRTNIEYFYDGAAVPFSYVNQYLLRASATVYIALENNYAGAAIRTVSIRSQETGNDLWLRPDYILAAENKSFHLGTRGPVSTDDGTIVVRNGRLVSAYEIFASDYANISLYGGNTAAVVNITEAPNTRRVELHIGRILSIDEGRSFRVETMSIFNGLGWNFTNIQREYLIDNTTMFMDESGLTSINSFIGYTPDNVLGLQYSVIVEGGKAVRVIRMPYTTADYTSAASPGHRVLQGIIYQVDGDTILLKDLHSYNNLRGGWTLISNRDATGTVNLKPNTVVIDRDDQVVGTNRLRIGQQVRVFTDTRYDPAVPVTSGVTADGYIVLVEPGL